MQSKVISVHHWWYTSNGEEKMRKKRWGWKDEDEKKEVWLLKSSLVENVRPVWVTVGRRKIVEWMFAISCYCFCLLLPPLFSLPLMPLMVKIAWLSLKFRSSLVPCNLDLSKKQTVWNHLANNFPSIQVGDEYMRQVNERLEIAPTQWKLERAREEKESSLTLLVFLWVTRTIECPRPNECPIECRAEADLAIVNSVMRALFSVLFLFLSCLILLCLTCLLFHLIAHCCWPHTCLPVHLFTCSLFHFQLLLVTVINT